MWPNGLLSALCVIKVWLSLPKDEEDTLYHIAKLVTEHIEEERAALGLGGIYRTPPEALAVVEKEIAADIVTMNPPLTMGGYLCDLLPVVKGGAR